jgi:2-haloacid dehalogenase
MTRWVLFDVNGTLTDLEPIGAPWGRPELGTAVLDHAVHSATVDALVTPTPRPFIDHLRAAIEVVTADLSLDETRVEEALVAATALPARADADQALALLAAAGIRLAALTNSGARGGEATLQACGLALHLERILGVDAVSSFKPHPSVYAYALRELDAPGEQVTMVATHPWDLAGARSAGIRSAWVRHGARRWPAVFSPPDLQAETLLDLARALIDY